MSIVPHNRIVEINLKRSAIYRILRVHRGVDPTILVQIREEVRRLVGLMFTRTSQNCKYLSYFSEDRIENINSNHGRCYMMDV
jgi:hypothetical protein